jgi:hypothetical protein
VYPARAALLQNYLGWPRGVKNRLKMDIHTLDAAFLPF